MTIDSVKNMKEALCEKLKVSFGSTVEEASDAQMMRERPCPARCDG